MAQVKQGVSFYLGSLLTGLFFIAGAVFGGHVQAQISLVLPAQVVVDINEWSSPALRVQDLAGQPPTKLVWLDQKPAYLVTDLTEPAFTGSSLHPLVTDATGLVQPSLELEACPVQLRVSSPGELPPSSSSTKEFVAFGAHCSDVLNIQDAQLILEHYGQSTQPAWGSVRILALVPHQRVQWCAQFSGCYLEAENTQSSGVVVRVLTQIHPQAEQVPRVLLVQAYRVS
jgi:hypothetical protein